MDMKAVRELDSAARDAKLNELRQELFNLRFQHSTAQLENTQRLKAVKQSIARILTVKNEKPKA
ncbi:50S ribosomal protein L29 [Desulfovibrio sp. X2]|uniref:50S ribosomal protein L29 n=1 Tax=Desulfovibrio sp. X2 TaxID=941449 RepID=UPI000358B0E7|nr:50S ribosomal protein L29 [Desulfovibrio sp. X2]EPR42628.1 50S ribosomal protein L29 [Desulfovibrio sp. X2]